MSSDQGVPRLAPAVAGLAVIASAAGLLMPSIYRDNTFVTSAWRASDQVTLFVSVPLMVAAWLRSKHGSPKALLILLGTIAYTLYAYAYYLFGAAFNALFLIYILLFVFSALALLEAATHIDIARYGTFCRTGVAARIVSGYLLFVAAGLTAVYVVQSLMFVITGELPAIVTMSGHPTSVVFAVDLSLLVPALLLSAVWLWRRKARGYVLAAVLAVKGPVYTLSLALGTHWAAQSGVPNLAGQLLLWLCLTVTGVGAAIWLLAAPRTQSVEDARC